MDATNRRRILGTAAALVVIVTATFVWLHRPRAITVTEGKFPEELVYVRSSDDVVNGGAMFVALKAIAKPIAVVWIHGWGTNFYDPSYTMIGRAVAARGYTCIIGNTRMHDIGTVAGYRMGKRIRGGGYWGIASEQTKDIAAWIDFAQARGFSSVILVGHSAGWAAVRAYQADTQDARVAGLISASGQIYPNDALDPKMLADAKRLIAEGRGDALLQFSGAHRSYPSYVSAATYADGATVPPEVMDFYGIRTSNPAVTRIRCPLLAWFGTGEDVGTAKDLEVLKASVRKQSSGPSRVDTVMIQHAGHMLTGEEQQVADVIDRWAKNLTRPR